MDEIGNYTNDIRKTWEIMKKPIGKCQETASALPKHIEHNKVNIFDQKLWAKNFNNIEPEVALKIPNSPVTFESYMTSPTSFLQEKNLKNE